MINVLSSSLVSFFLNCSWSSVFMAFFNTCCTAPLGTLAFCIAKGLPPAILQPASHLQLPTSSHKLTGQHNPERLWQYFSRDTLVIHCLDLYLQTLILLLWQVPKGSDCHWSYHHLFFLPFPDFYIWMYLLVYTIGLIKAFAERSPMNQPCSTFPSQHVLTAMITTSYAGTTHEFEYILI